MKIETPTTTFEHGFIQRTLRTSGMLLLLAFLFGTYYFGFYPALAVLSAGVWSMLNLMFLSALVRKALRPDITDKTGIAVVAIIKFPLLYASGYFLVTIEQFDAIPLVIGFSLVLAVMALKAAARVLFGLDYNNDMTSHERDSRGMA